MKELKFAGHRIHVDRFSHVVAHDDDGGSLSSQSVNSLLLFAILQELHELNAKRRRSKRHAR